MVYRLNIDQESKQNISNIKEYLSENKKVNFVGYFNHICFSDPLLAGHVAGLIDPKKTRHIIAPISYSHTDPERSNNGGTMHMKKISEACGVEMRRVIQTYQINNPEYGYTQEQANETYLKLFRRLKELNKSETATGCLICPEGHRSDDGILGPGEEGMLSIGRFLQPVAYVPIGISYEGDYNRSGLNFGKRLNLSVGEMIISEKGDKSLTTDILMRNLADILPIKMRGQWAESK